MPKGFLTELRQAFLEVGALVFGGIAGAGGCYLVFGESWILQAIFAIGGARLARYWSAAPVGIAIPRGINPNWRRNRRSGIWCGSTDRAPKLRIKLPNSDFTLRFR